MAEDSIRQIQQVVEDQLALFTCTTDYEIICALLDCGWQSPSDLRGQSRLSETSFYYTLRRLEERGLLVSRENSLDGRGKLYDLAPDLRALIMSQHRGYLALALQRDDEAAPETAPVRLTHDFIRRTPHTGHLTAEFQILLYLYVATRLSNLAMAHFVDVSQSKFNLVLRQLRERGLVRASPNPDDRRSRLYDLPEHVRAVLDEMHRQSGEWLARHDAREALAAE